MTHRTSRRFLYVVGPCVLVLAFVLASTGKVSAQGNPINAGFAAVLDAIAKLQSTVERLLPGGPATVRVTPALRFQNGNLFVCHVANVSDVPVTVRVRSSFKFLGLGGNSTNFLDSPDLLLPAGDVTYQTADVGQALDGYCTFTVMNGTAKQIRASIAVESNAGVEQVTVPAE